MTNGSMTEQLSSLLKELAYLIVPPFSDQGARATGADRLAAWIRVQAGVDAASLFMVNEERPHEIRYVSGVGYDPGYAGKAYGLGEWALTPHVFKTKQAINASAQELAQAGGTTPFSRSCQRHIENNRFLNIVAVPVLFAGNPLGVLKLENKDGTTDRDRFPERDLGLAKLVAELLGIIWQQRIYTGVWTAGRAAAETASDQENYLNRIASILRNALNAECGSVFLPSSNREVLKYVGGIGYESQYEGHEYSLIGKDASFTRYVFEEGTALTNNREQLEEQSRNGGIPFSGRCAEFIPSGEFRNILAVNLLGPDSSQSYGVLKLENRLPDGTEFSPYDLSLCKAFVAEQVLPTLRRLNGVRRKSGVDRLIARFGPKGARKDVDELLQVLSFQGDSEGDILEKDREEYLEMRHTSFSEMKKVAKSKDPEQLKRYLRGPKRGRAQDVVRPVG
jgi:hypothetical protein